MTAANPILVDVLRGGAVESRHRGALAIVDADGNRVLALGDVEQPVFPRSACKLLQALPLVASGAAAAFGLGDAELAMACASHSGEPGHVATAAGVLAKAGLSLDALECGTHWPRDEPVLKALLASGQPASALHNNCSGKHAGFVCLGCLMARQAGAEPAAYLRGYVGAQHPVMREVSAALAAATGADLARLPVGTDGCSIPTHAVPLAALALGFARAGTGQGLSPGFAAAARRLRQAIAASPWHVAGTDRFDTEVMQRLGERVCCKVGAEGVYAAALPEAGLGVAIKMDDGNTARAAEVAMAAVIGALVRMDEAERGFIAGLADAPIRNWRGTEVGRLRATEALLAPLRTQAVAR